RRVRQRGPHEATAGGGEDRRARDLRELARQPAPQGVSPAMDARDGRAVDRVSRVHRRLTASLRTAAAQADAPPENALARCLPATFGTRARARDAPSVWRARR